MDLSDDFIEDNLFSDEGEQPPGEIEMYEPESEEDKAAMRTYMEYS